MYSKPLLFSGIIFFFTFVLFSFLVDVNIFKQFDFDTTVRVQDNIPRTVDGFFSFFSEIGSFEVLLIVLLILLVLKRQILAGIITFFLFGLFHILEIIGKAVVDNTPPPQFMLRTTHMFEFPQFHVRSEFSYPSGHSGRTIFISAMLVIFIWHTKIPKLLKIVLSLGILLFDGIMLVSRVYLGEHWATDVIGGTLLGIAFGAIGSAFYLNQKHLKSK